MEERIRDLELRVLSLEENQQKIAARGSKKTEVRREAGKRSVEARVRKYGSPIPINARNSKIKSPNKTEQKTELNRTKPNKREQGVEACIEESYRIYPRKVGKKQGMAKLRTSVRTHEEASEFDLAVQRFIAYHKKSMTEARYIPHFSSFVRCWRDWLEKDAGQEEGFEKARYRGIAEIMKESYESI